MGQALYRLHRPKKLSDVVGQEHITVSLERALKKGTIAHAYLFTGPRGTGKTSIARILAHEINGLPYDDDSMHLDIIEIDAASNRRIDEIRDLRDKIHIAPTSAKYKVYIIDEVHMLTKEAFNALLKTLEEPPAHVVFMLATTEAHKLPETIISRTQRFSLKPVDLDKVTAHLEHIAKSENITIDREALQLIAAHGEGSFRDSISLLDQVRNSGEKILLADVQGVLGIAPDELVVQLVQAAAAGDTVEIVRLCRSLREHGYQAAQAAKQLGSAIRAQIIAGQGGDIELLGRLVQVPASNDPQASLEIALLEAALAVKPQAPTAAPPQKPMALEVTAKPPVQVEPHPSSFRKKTPKADTNEEPEEPREHSNAILGAEDWSQVLAAVKQRHNTLFAVVRAARPHFESGKVTLECAFAFHQKKLAEKASKKTLADVIEQTTGQNLQIVCTLGTGANPESVAVAPPQLPPTSDEQVHTVAATPQKPQTEAVKTISNIFGGAELLDS